MALLHLDNHFFVVVIWHSARDDVSATLNTVRAFEQGLFANSQTLLLLCRGAGGRERSTRKDLATHLLSNASASPSFEKKTKTKNNGVHSGGTGPGNMQYVHHPFFDPSVSYVAVCLCSRAEEGDGWWWGGGAASLPVVVPHVGIHEKKQMCLELASSVRRG